MTGDGARTLIWDAANRLKQVNIAASGANVHLAYGPDGSRARKSSPFKVTRYPSPDIEFSGSGTNASDWTRYPHMNVKVEGTTKYWLHRDHLASVRIVTDITGAPAESTNYASYGERINAAKTTEKGYIGERHDPETGLIYLNARYMDPIFGRFISPDDWDPTKQWAGSGKIVCNPDLITNAGNHLMENAAYFPICSKLASLRRAATAARARRANHVYDLYKLNLGTRRHEQAATHSIGADLSNDSISLVALTSSSNTATNGNVSNYVGTNRYSYSSNDPINRSDPNGHNDDNPEANSQPEGNESKTPQGFENDPDPSKQGPLGTTEEEPYSKPNQTLGRFFGVIGGVIGGIIGGRVGPDAGRVGAGIGGLAGYYTGAYGKEAIMDFAEAATRSGPPNLSGLVE